MPCTGCKTLPSGCTTRDNPMRPRLLIGEERRHR
jgi:hypothetical protein